MTNHHTFPVSRSGDSTNPPPGPPDRDTLVRMTPSALIRLQLELGEEENFFSMVGCHHIDHDRAEALDDDICRRLHELRRELIARARRDRTQQLLLSSGDDVRLDELQDAIRSRLDLPTFIARHVGLTAVGFRRVEDALVCPCPMPRDTATDSWLYVDPVAQTWCCTTCGMAGDIITFAMWFLGLQHVALFNFLGMEAGLPPIPLGNEE